MYFFFLMLRRPPRSTRTDTLFPDTTLFRSVGVVGTGATGVQVIPPLGAWAKHLYVFQRTPAAVDFRANRPTDPDWANALEPGWQKRRVDNFNHVMTGRPKEIGRA